MSLTCADCSSLGLDTRVGHGPPTGVCGSCGGPWPKDQKLRRVNLAKETDIKLVVEAMAKRARRLLGR
jgi:hypothetical protein